MQIVADGIFGLSGLHMLVLFHSLLTNHLLLHGQDVLNGIELD